MTNTNELETTVLYKTDYTRLTKSEEFLEALRQGGVDNWEFYGDSIQNYLKNNNLPEDYFDGI